jgi:HB1, ASXL, restriction endonuclease HTH domain
MRPPKRPVRIKGAGRLRHAADGDDKAAPAQKKPTRREKSVAEMPESRPPEAEGTKDAVPGATDANVGEPRAQETTPPNDLHWLGPREEKTATSNHLTWETADGKYRVTRTVPIDGAGRARYVPMRRNGNDSWIALENDGHGHCRGYQSLAKAIDEIESHLRASAEVQVITTNVAGVVLAAEQNGYAHITEEIEEMAKKTTTNKAKKSGTKPAKAERGMSCLDAADKVLQGAKEPMNCQEMIKAMADKGLWTSPGGLTPHATLYSVILRELKAKGSQARFKKAERGKFAATKTA